MFVLMVVFHMSLLCSQCVCDLTVRNARYIDIVVPLGGSNASWRDSLRNKVNYTVNVLLIVEHYYYHY